MGQVIQTSDAVAKDFLQQPTEQAIKLKKAIDGLEDSLEDTLKLTSQFLSEIQKQGGPKTVKQFEQVEMAVKAINDAEQQSIKIANLREKINKKLDDQLKDRIDGTEELTDLQKKQIRLEKTLTNSIDDQAVAVEELNVLASEQRKINKQLAKEKLGLVTVYERESKRLNELRKQYKSLALEGRENTQVAKDLKAEIDQLDESLKAVDASVGQNQRNVGNYTEGVKEAIESTGAFDEVLGSLSKIQNIVAKFTNIAGEETDDFADKTEGATRSQSGLVRGLGFTRKGLKRLKVAIAASGIGALLLAVASLGSFFSKSASGSRKFSKVLGGLGAVVSVLSGRLVLLGGAVVDVFQAFGFQLKAVSRLLKGDFSGAADAATKALNQQASASSRMERALGGTAKAASEAYDRGAQLADLEFINKENTRNIKLQVAELNKLAEIQQSIADDATRSFNQRESAGKKAAKASEDAAKKQLELALAEEEIAKRRFEIATVEGQIDEEAADALNESVIQRIEAEKELSLAVEENVRFRRELKQDELEKNLDILIDGFDNQKTINERLIADDRTTLLQKIDLFRKTEDEAQKSFNTQVETIQQFTRKRIDANELLATSDAVLLNQRIRSLGLSEIIEGRLLEVIRERRTALQDISDLERDLQAIREESAKEARATQETINETEQEQFKRQIELAEDVSSKEIEILKDKAKQSGDVSQQELAQLQADLDAEFELRKNALIAQAEFELSNEELTAEEKELINEKLQNDIARLDQQRVDQEAQTLDEIEKLNEASRQRIQKANREAIVAFAEEQSQALIEESQKTIEAIENEINTSVQEADALANAAAQGQVDAQKSIAEEKKRQNDLEAQRLNEQQKQQRIEATLAALKLIAARAEQGDADLALPQALTDISTTLGFIRGLDFFYEGTENTGTVSNPLDSKGGRLAVLHDNERVMTQNQNQKVGTLTNNELADIAFDYNNGNLVPFDYGLLQLNGLTQSDLNIIQTPTSLNTSTLERKLDKVNSSINDLPRRMPHSTTEWDDVYESLVTRMAKDGIIENQIHGKPRAERSGRWD